MSASVLSWLGLSMVVFVTANTLLRMQLDRPQIAVLVFALALFVIGNLINLRMMREGGLALVIALSGVLQMVILTGVAVALFGERPGAIQLLGMALGVLAVILIAWPRGEAG